MMVFNLVDNPDVAYPFAFLATYADASDGTRYYPLKYAFETYRDARIELLHALDCASDCCSVIGRLVSSGEVFYPIKLTATEAYEILRAMPLFESRAGIVCRMPDWWRRKSSKIYINVAIGRCAPPILSSGAIVHSQPELMVGGMSIDAADIEYLLAQTDGLVMLKGKWIELDQQKLREMLGLMKMYQCDMSLIQAVRLMNRLDEAAEKHENVEISNGEWLTLAMARLRSPAVDKELTIPQSVHAELRPYQKIGYQWLNDTWRLGFGACLADDMGLGKTLQVLAFLENMRLQQTDARVLLIVPASLIGNWEIEIEKFVPEMPYCVLHGVPSCRMDSAFRASQAFLYITTYGDEAVVFENIYVDMSDSGRGAGD